MDPSASPSPCGDRSERALFIPLSSAELRKNPPEECLGATIGLGSGASAAVPPFLHRRYRLSASSPVVVVPRRGLPALWRPEVKHVVHVGHQRAAEELWLVATADLARHPPLPRGPNKVYRRIDGDLSPFQTGASDTVYKPYEMRKMFQRFQEKVQWSDLVWRGKTSCVDKKKEKTQKRFFGSQTLLFRTYVDPTVYSTKKLSIAAAVSPPIGLFHYSISRLNGQFGEREEEWGKGRE